jgi:putative ABC transport system permease protein
MLGSMRAILWRLLHLTRRSESEASLDGELEFHLQMEIEENLRQGMSPAEARRHALIALGGLDHTREAYLQTWGISWLDDMRQDLAYAMRAMAKNPGFAAVGIMVLALGIGANTAIFSIVNAVLFRPLPVRAPEELLYVRSSSQFRGSRYIGPLSSNEFLYLRDRDDIFADVLGMDLFSDSGYSMKITTNGETGLAGCEFVTGNYFSMLGVKPMIGRTFGREEDQDSGFQPVAVIGDGLWKSRFNCDPEILGKTIQVKSVLPGLTAKTFTIIGVMRPEFSGAASPWSRTQVWVPLHQWCALNAVEKPTLDIHHAGFYVMARLKPGVTREQARAAVGMISQQLQRAYYPKDPSWSLTLLDSKPLRLPFESTSKLKPVRLAVALFAVTGMVLLIAAANLTGILMARVLTRRREIAARLALGASRVRIIRQLMTECLLLCLFGGVVGLVLARMLVGLFVSGTPSQFGHLEFSMDVPLDLRVLSFMGLVCASAAMLVGWIPAVQASNTDVVRALASGGVAGSNPTRSHLRHWIVIPQVCLSMILLLVAGIFVRTWLKTETVEVGYDPERLAFIEFQMPVSESLLKELGQAPKTPADRERINTKARVLREQHNLFDRRLFEKAKRTPDLTAVALADSLPLFPTNTYVVEREGFSKEEQFHWISTATVSPSYFQVLDVPLVQGRYFDERDTTLEPRRVAIVSQALARRLWRGRSPLGAYLSRTSPGSTYPPQWLEVVGVVKDVCSPLSEGGPSPCLYLPLGPGSSGARFLVARGSASPGLLVRGLNSAVSETDPAAEIIRCQSMADAIREMLFPRRMAAAILAISGLIGLLLASVGIYGVVSYSVAQRVKEIGIRAALGARKNDVMKLVMGEGIKVTLLGSALGLPLALAAIRIVSHHVVALPAMTWTSLVGIPLFLGAVILLACFIPARRAARVDPMVALKEL